MGDTVQSTFLHRLCNTPLRDALRGRLSARLDWRGRLVAANIPTPAQDLIARVIKRTRLWRVEKATVADELISHFRDAVQRAENVDSAVASFGEPRLAARLIRRSMIRKRPLLWHAGRWTARFALALLLVVALSFPFYLLSRPHPSVDYLSQINSPATSVPESQRAWPLYRQASLQVIANRPLAPHNLNNSSRLPSCLWHNVDGPSWPQMSGLLTTHRDALEMLRAGADKPVLGFILGPGGSGDDPALYWPGAAESDRRDWAEFPLVEGLILPQLHYTEFVVDLLEADAKLAQIEKDPARLQRDILSIINVADQVRTGNPFFVTDQVAIRYDRMALDAIERVLTVDPSALSDRQLIELAHRIATPRVAADLIQIAGVRMLFYDLVQHVYSDDGTGNGHLTPAGLHLMIRAYGEAVIQNHGFALDISREAGPANLVASVSRRQLLAAFDRLMDSDRANLNLPMRNANWRHSQAILSDLNGSPWSLFRYGPTTAIIHNLFGDAVEAERYLGRRDGVMTAIALELYRREHKTWPDRLDQLTPQFLPALPADRITGAPIRYSIRDGRPMLYSVGIDRIDDGGYPPPDGTSFQYSKIAYWPIDSGRPIAHGDWILYPAPLFMD